MQENLTNLKGAKTSNIDIEGFSGFKVEIFDLSLWGQNIKQLISLFGKVIFEEYEKEIFDIQDSSQINRALHQLEISFKDIDYMLVLYKENDFVGLIAMKVLRQEPKIGVVIELILNPDYRGQGISKKLYGLVFKPQDFYAITSYSRYPAAVSARYKTGNIYGYDTIFGDMPTKNPEITKLQNYATDYFSKEGIVSKIPVPQGYIFLKGEENVNAPLKEGDAKFSKSDPLYSPFQKILEIQKTNDKDTAVGLLVSVKKSL